MNEYFQKEEELNLENQRKQIKSKKKQQAIDLDINLQQKPE